MPRTTFGALLYHRHDIRRGSLAPRRWRRRRRHYYCGGRRRTRARCDDFAQYEL